MKGKKNLAPYWRTFKSGGVINEKYPGGVEEQKKLLEKEGHRVDQIGKRVLLLILKRPCRSIKMLSLQIGKLDWVTPPVRKRIAVFAEGRSRNF